MVLVSGVNTRSIVTTSIYFTVPAVRYLVSVEAGGGSGCGPAMILECYTEEGQPPMVTGVGVDRLSSTTMDVSWIPLNKAQAGGFIQNYVITYTVSTGGTARKQTTVSADRNSEIISGLDPITQYDITVAAQSRGGTSECEC